jgi:hypothetical protein
VNAAVVRIALQRLGTAAKKRPISSGVGDIDPSLQLASLPLFGATLATSTAA